jgi:dTDP-4-amino-4,6-dideoxygalactose transaminase
VKKLRVNVTQPFLPDLVEFLPYLEQIWESKNLTNGGAMHQRLESELEKYLGVERASLVSSGTMGLMLALKALEVDGEVITTPYTFIATTNAICWAGAKPCFVDVDPNTLNIDPSKIESAITSKTSAILAVHSYGNPCDVEMIHTIAQKYKLKVIYDAAHFFNPDIFGDSVLKHGDLSVLSFHATKVFNTFEGGAIISSNPSLYAKINRLKNFGFGDGASMIEIGINGKLNEFQSALGLLQLKYVERSLQALEKIDNIYRQSLELIPGISCLGKAKRLSHSSSYFPIFINSDYPLSRDELCEYLKSAGINTRAYFYPLTSSHPFYASLPSAAPVNLPVANRLSKSVLCLPMYPDLQNDAQLAIIELIQSQSLGKTIESKKC